MTQTNNQTIDNMKRIDFSRIKLEVEPGRFEVLDQRRAFGNAIYGRSLTLELDTLARKVYTLPKGWKRSFLTMSLHCLFRPLPGNLFTQLSATSKQRPWM